MNTITTEEQAMEKSKVEIRPFHFHVPEEAIIDLRRRIAATRRILHNAPYIRVLVVTMFEDDGTIFAAMRVALEDTFSKMQKKKTFCAPFRRSGMAKRFSAQQLRRA